MKKIYLFLMILTTIFTMMSCGGDDASSSGGGGGGDSPINNSSVGAWYVQSGSYMLVWDFADNGAVTLHLYEISGDVYYKTQASGRYTKKDNTINFTIGGDASSATIIDNVMHLNDPDLGSLQLTKVNSSVQSSINTMEAYFDRTQKEAVGEWYVEDAGMILTIAFDATGKGKIVEYSGAEKYEIPFTWSRGNIFSYSSDYADKFNIKNGVLTIVETDNSTNKTYTISFRPMTDDIRLKIEDMQKPVALSGSYVREGAILGDRGYHVFCIGEENSIYWFTVDGNGLVSNPHYYTYEATGSTIKLTDLDSGEILTGTISNGGNTVSFGGITYVKKANSTEVPSGEYEEVNADKREYFSLYVEDSWIAYMVTHEGSDVNGDGVISDDEVGDSVSQFYRWFNTENSVHIVSSSWSNDLGDFYFNNDGTYITVGEIVFARKSSRTRPEIWSMLMGTYEKAKVWTWDSSVNGYYWGLMGYHASSGKDVGLNGAGTYWGIIDEDDFKTAFYDPYDSYRGDGNPNAYMTFDYNGMITSVDANGVNIRYGYASISNYNNSNPNAYHHGYLETTEGCILWPYEVNGYGNKPTRYEIAYVDDNHLTLVYPKNGDFNASPWTSATFWHFKYDPTKSRSSASAIRQAREKMKSMDSVDKIFKQKRETFANKESLNQSQTKSAFTKLSNILFNN